MHRTLPLVASLANVEAIERTPLAEQYSIGSTYEILQARRGNSARARRWCSCPRARPTSRRSP